MNNNRFNAILESKDEVIASLKRQLKEKDDVIASMDRTIATKDRTIALQEETWKKNREIIDKCHASWFEQDKLIAMYDRRVDELTRQLKMQKKGVSADENELDGIFYLTKGLA